jgi:hypothetical protein
MMVLGLIVMLLASAAAGAAVRIPVKAIIRTKTGDTHLNIHFFISQPSPPKRIEYFSRREA